jgi:hypothetical protein|tara:strand:- start:111 stop:266 length:156 start_codon:yes stop_codon:yes gene_type:complete
LTPEHFKDHKKEQLDRIEKKIDILEQKLDNHINEIWKVYKPIKKLIKYFGK